MKTMSRLDRADLNQTKAEISKLEKQLLSDIDDMMCEAQTALIESKVLTKFYSEVGGRRPSNNQIDNLREAIRSAIIEKVPKFEYILELVVKRDGKHQRQVQIEFKVRSEVFSV